MNKVQHVLMTADTVGGVWNYSLELARAVGKHGVHVSLATMGARVTPSQRAEANKLDNITLYESDFKLEWMPEPWDDVDRAGEWLQKLEDLLSPDVVHLNGFCHGSVPFKAPRMVVCHSCVLSWWMAVKQQDAPIEWLRYEDAVTEGLQSADMVVAPTKAMLDMACGHYGCPPNSRVIYNGRDAAHFPPLKKEELILSAGRLWDEGKNVAALDAVASELPWPVCVAGESASPVGGAAHQRHVQGLGYLPADDMANWLGRASIYAAPARYEPFGLSILEAGLAGCALVLGDIPTLKEVWGDAACYVQPDDLNSLQTCLMNMIRDDSMRAKMAHRARAKALEYTPERMAQQYVSAYMEIAENQVVRTTQSGRAQML